ncbi:MAG TPA: hypothetical protein VMY59_09740 [Candidatus Thermoplasmatota archaeon]|nr:hypothetical protein [Candidatus Thermoplasmatota archaeon]
MHRHTTTNKYRVRKNTTWFSSKKVVGFLIVPLMITIILSLSPSVFSKTPMYIPSIPNGTTFGYVGIDYDYVIVTMNPDSSWMFDWGDGTLSSWLQLEDNQTSISQIHHWNLSGTYQVHVKYKSDTVPYGIWSEAMIVDINEYSSQNFPNTPFLNTGKIKGIVGNEYTYSALTTDPQNFPVCYRFSFGSYAISEWTAYVPSDSSAYFLFTWEKPGSYILRTQARNQYGLESEWSAPVQVIMQNTSENNTEASMDLVVLNDIPYQIIYTSLYNGTLFNPSTGASNDIHWNGGGVFLIDDDSDGRSEYLYVPAIGQIQPHTEQILPQSDIFAEIPWVLILIILSIVFGVIGVVIVLIKTGYIYLYEEEVVVEE